MKKTIVLIISVILVVAIFASCDSAIEGVATTDEETEAEVTGIEEDSLAELDSSSNTGLPIDTRFPQCCKNGCGKKLSRALPGPMRTCIRQNQDCFKCSKCQTQYVRHQDGDRWEYCDVQISTKDPKCCKCDGKLQKNNTFRGFDTFTCEKCGQAYHRYWQGDFWDYA